MSLTTTIPPQSGRGDRRWWALALLATAEFMVILDASIVNIALPSIGRGLHISLANLSWAVNAYS
jgi:predicted MFS family arabinose efflux permease